MQSKKSMMCLTATALAAVLLAACGGTGAADAAVCEAYQVLTDTWPSNSEEVQAAASAMDIWDAVSDTGAALIAAAESAGREDLREAGLQVGEWAANYYENNKDYAVGDGFIPFFNENQTPGGSVISSICEEIGTPITLQ
ncbi:MAG: hypothetical protein JXA97_12105 [Anaerolineales bacterium]|nr:hypothetical protein [Anaerolineales bacterium]